ncbi:MAG: hypothetical protein ACREMP_01695 [Candidatus Tyrphobacter sp.]
MNALVLMRGVFAALYVVAGAIIFARLALVAPVAGWRIVSGAVLGLAMIALGVHRIVLIWRTRGAP